MKTPIQQIKVAARIAQRTRDWVAESSAWGILDLCGIPTPARCFIKASHDSDIQPALDLDSDCVVLKAIAPGLAHKAQAGGIEIVPNRRDAVENAVKDLVARLPNCRSIGAFEWIPHSREWGSEIMLGFRWTADLDLVGVVAAGGNQAEVMAANMLPEQRLVAIHERLMDRVPAQLAQLAVLQAHPHRERAIQHLMICIEQAFAVAGRLMPQHLGEFEFNPLAWTERGWVALDVLAKPASNLTRRPLPRPLQQIQHLLHPQSVALMGVSKGVNPGRVILQNLLRGGFHESQLTLIKPGLEQLDGCRCVAEISDLKEPVDLVVVCVKAERACAALEALIDQAKARSILLIPGGLEEKSGGADLKQVVRSLQRSRARPDGGTVINGGNCVGIRSVTGHLDTIFLPQGKLPAMAAQDDGFALISQSGAMMVSLLDRLEPKQPRFAISVGNQTDLTIADYVEYLQSSDLHLIAVYSEGLRSGDGPRLLQLARNWVAGGKRLIVYRAGRTDAGAKASASHTAAIAGDYPLFANLMQQAGATLARDLGEFTSLIDLSLALREKPHSVRKLAVVSNAGFECVAAADGFDRLEPAEFSPATGRGLRQVMTEHGIDSLVDIHNPLDATPMLNDAGMAKLTRVLLRAPEVDAVIVGMVPLTPALETLPKNASLHEDIEASSSIAQRLIELSRENPKPLVVVVDGGSRYRPLRDLIRQAGLPVFDRMDLAMSTCEKFWDDTRVPRDL